MIFFSTLSCHSKWIKNFFFLSFTAALLGVFLASVKPVNAEESGIGRIKSVDGLVFVQRQDQRIPVTIGTTIQPKDQLITGNNGVLVIVFNDHTVVSLGPESTYHIEDFMYQPDQDRFSYKATLKKGSMQFRSGNIAKYHPKAVQLKTSTAQIGVRGTLFIVQVEKPDSKNTKVQTDP